METSGCDYEIIVWNQEGGSIASNGSKKYMLRTDCSVMFEEHFPEDTGRIILISELSNILQRCTLYPTTATETGILYFLILQYHLSAA